MSSVLTQAALFGSNARSKTLVAIALLRETYSRELARLTGLPLISVQRIIKSLERESVVVGRAMGTTRIVTLNPRLSGVDELQAFLIKYAKRMPDLVERIEGLRRRPRRSAKEL